MPQALPQGYGQEVTLQPMSKQSVETIGDQSNSAPDDLFQRVIQAESGGNQSAVSNKGAIGVAQIMPKTAPDAAKAAGLPYDPKRLKTDPEYNAALGKAYLDKMLDKYQGNEAHALMAYNWGQGNVDMWLKSGGDPRRIPKETKDYLTKILG
jgi:soluble lytic murein transglycosylase